MERFIAIDTGKFATKIAEYDPEKKTIRKFSFRTRHSFGDFRDDALENNTYLAEIDGKVHKVGNGARGQDAELNSSKTSEEHRICALTALAACCSRDEVDDINVAVCLPAKEWAIVENREKFKAFMFPEGEISIAIRDNHSMLPTAKRFRVKSRFCFPESYGALLCSDEINLTPNSYIGVLDIGNLNLNATSWQGRTMIEDESITDELGGSILIQTLSQELSFHFGRCSEQYVAQILVQPPEKRYLVPTNQEKQEEVMKESKTVIKRCLLDHVKKIKRCCDGRGWSLNFMDLIAIGGTCRVLQNELKEVFGENIHILKNPIYCNVVGSLRLMCKKLPQIGEWIPVEEGGR